MRRGLDERLAALAARDGGLVAARSAAQAGIGYATLRWAADRGQLRPARRGVYITRSAWEAADERGRHVLLLRAGQLRVPGAVAVAESAAVVLGLPLPAGPPPEPRLLLPRVRSRGPGGRGREAGGLGRRAILPDSEVWTMPDGLRVTAPGRTVVDCARHLDLPWSLAVGDAARSGWRLSHDRLREAAAANPCAPGHPAAVWVARLARPEPESPLESLARAIVVIAGHPEPRCQVWVTTREGEHRVDLLDASGTVVIEADGRLKYSGPDDVWREKRREDSLRDLGLEVVRFTLVDYRARARWLAGFERALARSAARGGSLPVVR